MLKIYQIQSHWENKLALSQHAKQLPYDPKNSISKYISMRNEDICPHKISHANVHSNIIQKSPKIGTSQIPINW